MIRPLADINEEFRAEIAAASLSAQDAPVPGENDDAAGLASSLDKEARTGPRTVRKLPRYTIPIAVAIVAIILIFVGAALALGGTPPPESVSEGASGTRDAFVSVAGAGEVSGAAEQGAGARDSASENAENDSNAARESEEERGADPGAAGGEAAIAKPGIAALYGYIIGFAQLEDADMNADADAMRQRRQSLIERINAYFPDDAGEDAALLPSDARINADAAFTSLTESANALTEAVIAGREHWERLSEVIDLHRRAYELYPLPVLKTLLARDYAHFGQRLSASGQHAEEAFDAFVYSIIYRVECLRELPPESDARREEIQRIGTAYASIAAIDGLDAECRRHAAWIGDCLSEPEVR
jgi:hypothetical protein